ncbi:histidinol-phosphate transaminase [Thalassotalea fusca]
MSVANKLARPELNNMVPYQSARRLYAGSGEFESKVWLNANEASGSGVYQLNGSCINRYPDFQPTELIAGYSQYCTLPAENILATRGADEGIELIIRTFCRAYQDSILVCPPTYGMYAISAENHGAMVKESPLVNNQLNVDDISSYQDEVKVVFLCSPGNPTGNLLQEQDVKAVIELFADKAMVVVDEAYIEFAPENSATKWLSIYDNLIVLRTLSKAFALAGLRCGFTLANPSTIELLSKVIAPYPVPAPVAQIAANALSVESIMQMQGRVQESNTLRASLSEWLRSQPWCEQVFDSNANFVLFRTAYKDYLFDTLKDQDVLIRDQSKQQQLANCLRISIGSSQELNIVKEIISNAMKNKVMANQLNEEKV